MIKHSSCRNDQQIPFVCSYLIANWRIHLLQHLIMQFRSFDPRKECILLKYSYLLPTEIICIQIHSSNDEIDYHLSKFNDILKAFELGPCTANIFLVDSHHERIAHQQKRVYQHQPTSQNKRIVMGKKILKLMGQL